MNAVATTTKTNPPSVSDALAYSRNFATAKPDIGTTEREHILGLCDLLERRETAVAELVEALDNTAASLETMLAWFGDKCPAEDGRARERVLATARAALARFEEV